MLLATNFDVPFVQSQSGHSDSKLTMDVYAQLLDHSKRAHGAAFDALVSDAQATLNGAQQGSFRPSSDFDPAAAISAEPEIGLDTEESPDGRGGFRTCDLSRVKQDCTRAVLPGSPCKSGCFRSLSGLRKPVDLGSIRRGLGQRRALLA